MFSATSSAFRLSYSLIAAKRVLRVCAPGSLSPPAESSGPRRRGRRPPSECAKRPDRAGMLRKAQRDVGTRTRDLCPPRSHRGSFAGLSEGWSTPSVHNLSAPKASSKVSLTASGARDPCARRRRYLERPPATLTQLPEAARPPIPASARVTSSVAPNTVMIASTAIVLYRPPNTKELLDQRLLTVPTDDLSPQQVGLMQDIAEGPAPLPRATGTPLTSSPSCRRRRAARARRRRR